MDTNEIKKVLQNYFDAGYVDDGDAMGETFHDGAHLYSLGEDGTLQDWSKEFFVNLVNSNNTDPANPGYPRYEEILSIDFTGENTAVARVRLRVRETMYTDILSFLRINGKWAIMAKVFTGVPA